MNSDADNIMILLYNYQSSTELEFIIVYYYYYSEDDRWSLPRQLIIHKYCACLVRLLLFKQLDDDAVLQILTSS